MRIVIAALAAAAGAAHADPCADPGVTARIAALVRAHRFADAHHAATDLRVQCGDAPAAATWRLLDDIALVRLEDRAWAVHDLDDLAARAPDPLHARVVLAWAYAEDRDDEAAAAVLAKLPTPRAAAIAALEAVDDRDAFAAHLAQLPRDLAEPARALGERYDDAAHTKHPVLAGILSALLPGAGQIYDGSLQAAGVTFALNGLFVGTTIEQAAGHHWATAAAAATVASFFYVGGVINAVDLARRRDRIASQPARDQLEQLLVPEVGGAVE